MIAIVDYGLGNITAFTNVLDRINAPFVLAATPEAVRDATKIILPGVGSFDYAMARLDASGMREALDARVVGDGVPVLGVCVGMQMMAGASEEGSRPGLGWIDAHVRRFVPSADADVRIPHMGWNNAVPARAHPLLHRLDTDARFYFLHSYYVECREPADVLATTEYDGTFACAVAHGNMYGVQFHPEKSHRWGSQLLQNFAQL